MNFTKTTGIMSITKRYPQTMNVFSRYGCNFDKMDDTSEQTLEQLCLEHALDYEEVVTELYKTLE